MDFEGQYLTYDDYEELGGDLPEMPFNLLEYEARQEVYKYTFGRLKDLDPQVDEVKICVYRLINYLDSYNKILEKVGSVTSESTDGYSVSYSKMGIADTQTKDKIIKDIVKLHLIDCKLDDGTPYMYCGADR